MWATTDKWRKNSGKEVQMQEKTKSMQIFNIYGKIYACNIN